MTLFSIRSSEVICKLTIPLVFHSSISSFLTTLVAALYNSVIYSLICSLTSSSVSSLMICSSFYSLIICFSTCSYFPQARTNLRVLRILTTSISFSSFSYPISYSLISLDFLFEYTYLAQHQESYTKEVSLYKVVNFI
jgi:hypothetical protein